MFVLKHLLITIFLFFVRLNSAIATKRVLVQSFPEELRRTKSFPLTSSGVYQRIHDFSDISDENPDLQASGSGFYTVGAAVPYPGRDYHHLNYGEEQKKGGQYYREGVGANRGEVGFYGNTGHRGASDRVATDVYSGNHNQAKGDAIQSGYYDGDHRAHKGYDTGRSAYGGEQFDKTGQAQAQYGSKGGHRKGHHSSGFKSSYYKDESGNNSRFYDDDNDEGGHYVYDSRGGKYHDNGGNNYHDRHHDGLYDKEDRGQQGHFGSVAGYDNAHKQDDHRARNNYYDQLDYGQLKGGGNIGENVEGKHQKEVAGVSYHKAKSEIPYGYHGKQEYWNPAVLGTHVAPIGYYGYNEGKNYYPISSYNTENVEPFNGYYKDYQNSPLGVIRATPIRSKGYASYEDSPLDVVHGTPIKAKGYAYYEDNPLGNHYYD